MARKDRKPRKLKKAIAIIGEGISEQEYFKSLKRNRKYSFKVKPELPKKSDFSSIFDKAKNLIEEDEYSFVYCLIDMDYIINDKLQNKFLRESKNIIKTIGRDKIKIINSNPCFEVWFLFHFLQRVPFFSTDSTVSEKLRNYSPFKNYDKSKKFFKNVDIYKELEDKVNSAITNAKKVTPQNIVSYTDVFLILEKLK